MKIKDLLIHESKWINSDSIIWNKLNTNAAVDANDADIQVLSMINGYCIRLSEQQMRLKQCAQIIYFEWDGEKYVCPDLVKPPPSIKREKTVTDQALNDLIRSFELMYESP
jgi:hypothetical protein